MSETLSPQQRSKKPLLWVSMASIGMAFAGLTSGYLVSKSSLEGKGSWLDFPLPEAFYYSTIFIVISSALLILAGVALKQDANKRFAALVFGSFAFGLAFMVSQITAWLSLMDQGIWFTGVKSQAAGSWLYVITWFHWMHVLAGVIVLLVVMVKALSNRYNQSNRLGFDLAVQFWHYLGGLWLYLLLFLVFLR